MSWALDPLSAMSLVDSACVGQMWSAEDVIDASLAILDSHAAGVSIFKRLVRCIRSKGFSILANLSQAHLSQANLSPIQETRGR